MSTSQHQDGHNQLPDLAKSIDNLLPQINKEISSFQSCLCEENETLREEVSRKDEELQQLKVKQAATLKCMQEFKEESTKLRREVYELRVQLRSLQHSQMQQLISISNKALNYGNDAVKEVEDHEFLLSEIASLKESIEREKTAYCVLECSNLELQKRVCALEQENNVLKCSQPVGRQQASSEPTEDRYADTNVDNDDISMDGLAGGELSHTKRPLDRVADDTRGPPNKKKNRRKQRNKKLQLKNGGAMWSGMNYKS